MSPTQAQLRKTLLAQREALTATFCKAANKTITQHILQHPQFQISQRVALYWPKPYQNEVDVRDIITAAPEKTFYLPKITSEQSLIFLPFKNEHELIANRFGIFEPPDANTPIAPQQLDLVIVPVVGFDDALHRIGWGAGFYDRTFAFLKDGGEKPFLLGAAFSIQHAGHIPLNPWDVVLNGVVTEVG